VKFLNETKTIYGGYGKLRGALPDVMHSYMGLAGLSLINYHEIPPIWGPLGLSNRALTYAKSLGLCGFPPHYPS
jgi:prenyltransferase beta subunit